MIPSLVDKMVFRFHAFIPKWCSCGAAGMLCSGTSEHVGLTSPHIWDISDNLIHECLYGMLCAREAKNIYPYSAIYDNFTSVFYI